MDAKYLLKELTTDLKRAEAGVEKWRKDFADQPWHALKWSAGVFYDVAATGIIPRAIEVLKNNGPEALCVEALLHSVQAAAHAPTGGDGHSLMEAAEYRAWGEIARRFEVELRLGQIKLNEKEAA